MKALKITYKILLILSFSLLAFSIFLHIVCWAYEELGKEYEYSSLIFNWRMRLYLFAILALFIGFGLCFLNKKLANLLGLSLLGASFLIFVIVYTIGHYAGSYGSFGLFDSNVLIGANLIIILLNLIAVAVLYGVIEKIANKPVKENKEDVVMGQLLKWKQLQEKSIITEEEFEEKKKEILTKLVEE